MKFINRSKQSGRSNIKFGVIKLVLVTECSLLSYGLTEALSGSEFIFMTDAMSGNEFSSELEKNRERWDLVILDRDCLSENDTSLLTKLINATYGLPVVILSSCFRRNEHLTYYGAGAGAGDCISKSIPETEYASIFINVVRKHNMSKRALPEPVSISYRELNSMTAFNDMTSCEKYVVKHLFKGL